MHGLDFYTAAASTPHIFDYLPFGPFNDATALENSIETYRRDNTRVLYAVLVRPGVPDREGNRSERECLAGTIGLLQSEYHNALTEIGAVSVRAYIEYGQPRLTWKVMITSKWQRTCVSTHAIGLLLHELLDPLPPHGTGVGLRRVQWQCHADNAASRHAAERMGFVYEGTTRWCRVLPEGKSGVTMTGKGRMFGDTQLGRHSCMLAITWEDWEKGGARDKADALMRR